MHKNIAKYIEIQTKVEIRTQLTNKEATARFEIRPMHELKYNPVHKQVREQIRFYNCGIQGRKSANNNSKRQLIW